MSTSRFKINDRRYLHIYPIICLKYVCLSTFAKCRSKFLVDCLGRCLKLIASSRGTFCHEFASQFGLEFVYTQKNRKPVARPAAVDRHSVADKQLNWNGHNPSACIAQCQERKRSSEMQRSRFKPCAGNNIFFICIVLPINKAYF